MTQIDIKDIYWLAGLLEGEGSFSSINTNTSSNYPTISLETTDLDVIQKAYKLFNPNSNITIHKHENSNYKLRYSVKVNGKKAIGWMFTLYSLMGNRRKEKIKEVILKWKNRTTPAGRKAY